MIRPYLERMTRSELMAIMVGGFSNTAGGVLLAYISMLKDRVPNIGAHLLTSSILTGPASLMMAKLEKLGISAVASASPAELDAFIRAESERWSRVLRENGNLKLD